jgi:L-asparagine transporter-like permease
VVIYAGVSAAVIAGRVTGSTARGAYRMPLFPLAPAASLLALTAVLAADLFDPEVGRPSLVANLIVMALSAGYYVFVLRRRRDWALRGEGGSLLATKAD